MLRIATASMFLICSLSAVCAQNDNEPHFDLSRPDFIQVPDGSFVAHQGASFSVQPLLSVSAEVPFKNAGEFSATKPKLLEKLKTEIQKMIAQLDQAKGRLIEPQ